MPQNPTVKSVNARLAEELAVDEVRVTAAVQLLDEGATVVTGFAAVAGAVGFEDPFLTISSSFSC